MSPRRIARILAGAGAVVLVAIVLVTVWVVRHRKDVKALTNAAGLLPGAFLHARNFHWTQMKGDQSQWTLQAKDASYAADKTSMVLKGADLKMIGKDGKRVELRGAAGNLADGRESYRPGGFEWRLGRSLWGLCFNHR